MSRRRKIIGKWLNNNKVIFVLSIFLAVVIWLVVALQFSERTKATFTEIPVTIDTTMPDGLKLKQFGQKVQTVTVTVIGKRNEISSAVLSRDDFVVTASAANATLPGKYTLPITVRTKDLTKDIEIVSFSPEFIECSFDRETQKTFTVAVQIDAPDGKIAADGLNAGEAIIVPKSVTISGAETEINSIEQVVAKVKLDEPLVQQETFSNVELLIKNSNGGVVRSDFVSVNGGVTDVAVTIPVYTKVKVTPSVQFVNQPSYFENHAIQYTLSPSGAVEVGVPEDMLDTISSYAKFSIDFSEILPGDNSITRESFDSSRILIIDGEPFRIDFSIHGCQTRKYRIPVSAVSLTGAPEDMSVSLPEDTVLEVTVAGFADELDMLTIDDIRASVNVSDLSKDANKREFSVTLALNRNTESCWIAGQYSMPVTVHEQ